MMKMCVFEIVLTHKEYQMRLKQNKIYFLGRIKLWENKSADNWNLKDILRVQGIKNLKCNLF